MCGVFQTAINLDFRHLVQSLAQPVWFGKKSAVKQRKFVYPFRPVLTTIQINPDSSGI
jgi:hypothetical protein